MGKTDKPLVWLHGEVKTPPFSPAARLEVGWLPKRLLRGELLAMPHARAMPTIGRQCHELRIVDRTRAWRILFRIDPDAIVIIEVFEKKTRQTPKAIIDLCRNRLKDYDRASR